MGGYLGIPDDLDALLTMYKQAGIGVAGTSAIFLPLKEGSTGPKFSQDLKQNEARFQDGVRRKSNLGKPGTSAELPLTANLDLFGYPLHGFCALADTVSVVAIEGTNDGGLGYADGPVVVTIAAPGGGGTTATATATAAGGKVMFPLTIWNGKIINPGSGYNFSTPPVVTIAAPGGGGTTATATAVVRYHHSGKAVKGVLPLYTLEDVIAANLLYVYLDQIFTDLNIDFEIEGNFAPSFTTMGSGLPPIEATAPIDSTPTIVGSGQPASMLNWATLEDGVDSGIIEKCSLKMKRTPMSINPSGSNGVARDLWSGSIDIAVTATAFFNGFTRIRQSRALTLTALKNIITQGYNALQIFVPELEVKPVGEIKKEKDKPRTFDIEGGGIYDSNVNSPVFFDLYNTVATHSTT